MLMEAFEEDADEDVMWLGKTVAVERFGRKGLPKACYKKMEKTMKLHVGMSRSTMFNNNDYAIAIDWFERVADDLERRTFVRGDGVTCFVNSTELRHIVSEEGITESKSSAGDSTWKLDRVEEVRGEDYCR